MNPIRVTKTQASKMLAISTEAIRKLIINDPTFPKPYKSGMHRQSAVYFDYAELVAWHEAQKTQV
ncbi:helix-turn-helix transcriptional regulator [Moraxella bovoculi]|uniref:helix-turn-helix transcriptional regulator n=1 Tax=Moraxella bovoculi TaxID=386891 RepID=UPI000624B658|nr:hypothetical protein [Moraxella bovoculi]AKG14819.2 transcriptional regulator [Moraxella bovoculi]